MANKYSIPSGESIAPVIDSVKESLRHHRVGLVVSMIRKLEFKTITPNALVGITCLSDGNSQRLAGFSSLNSLKSLHNFLSGNLFPDAPSQHRSSITEAIVKDLLEEESQSEEYCPRSG